MRRASKTKDGKCGPMVYYFPKGRTPVLSEDVAADFIARGVAEPCGVPVAQEREMSDLIAEMAKV